MKIDLLRIFFRFWLKNKKSEQKKINIDKVKVILVVSNTAIGDTLFSTPALRLIKNSYPNKKIIALLNPKNIDLFRNNPSIDEYLEYDGKWRSFLRTRKTLIQKEIDIALILHANEPQITPLIFFSNIKIILKAPNNNNEFKHLHYNSPIAKSLDKHFIDTRLELLEYIGIKEKSYLMDLFFSADDRKDRFKVSSKVWHIGFQIGASTPSREWNNNGWSSLAEQF